MISVPTDAGLLMPGHVAVVLVLAGRGVDDDLLGAPGAMSTSIPSSSMEKLCGVTPSLGKFTVTSVFAGIVTSLGSK